MPLNAFQIYKLLPKTNCKECGESTCMAFATKLISQERKIEECPYLEGANLRELNNILIYFCLFPFCQGFSALPIFHQGRARTSFATAISSSARLII